MSKTLVSIKLDANIKKEAQKAAEDLGLSLSAVVNATLREFVRSKELHVSADWRPTAYLTRVMERAERNYEEGKEVSPRFHDVEDAIKWLKTT